MHYYSIHASIFARAPNEHTHKTLHDCMARADEMDADVSIWRILVGEM